MFDRIVLAVSVMTDCRPPTSLASQALDVAGPRGGEEAQRQGLQVGVELRPEIAEHPLSHGVGQIALPDAHERGDYGSGDYQRQQLVQQAEIGAALDEQRLVEDHLDEEWADHPEAACHHDENDGDPELPPIGPEKPGYPA